MVGKASSPEVGRVRRGLMNQDGRAGRVPSDGSTASRAHERRRIVREPDWMLRMICRRDRTQTGVEGRCGSWSTVVERAEGGRSSSTRPSLPLFLCPPQPIHPHHNHITTMTELVASSRPPSLPTETHAHILSYCDAQTLARASRVSLAFLQLAGPHLYEHITIRGFKQLERMFYREVCRLPASWRSRCSERLT